MIQEASFIAYESDHSTLRSMVLNNSYILESNWLRTVEVKYNIPVTVQ